MTRYLTTGDLVAIAHAAMGLVEQWRETVWRNAERLLNATDATQLAAVEQSIEANAASEAQAIASAPQEPGYRATRDAYCAAHVKLDAVAPPAPVSTAKAKTQTTKRASAHRRHPRRKHRHHHRRTARRRHTVTRRSDRD